MYTAIVAFQLIHEFAEWFDSRMLRSAREGEARIAGHLE